MKGVMASALISAGVLPPAKSTLLRDNRMQVKVASHLISTGNTGNLPVARQKVTYDDLKSVRRQLNLVKARAQAFRTRAAKGQNISPATIAKALANVERTERAVAATRDAFYRINGCR